MEIGMPSLIEMAVGHHELYLSWLEAGFNEEQAMDLLMVIIETMIREAANG